MTQERDSVDNHSTPSVIIVDDEEMVITSIKAYLQLETGYDVRGFTDPEDAARHLEAEDADVVVSDYLMPRMNGIQLRARQGTAAGSQPGAPDRPRRQAERRAGHQ